MLAAVCKRSSVLIFWSISAVWVGAQDRSFHVRDSIEMTTFSEPPRDVPGAVAPSSPNGRYIAVVTSRGVLRSDQVETSVRLFDTRAVNSFLMDNTGFVKPPTPRIVAKITETPVAPSGASYSPLISDLRWASSSQALYFLAQNSLGQHYLCRVKIASGRLEVLSPKSNYDVERYSLSGELGVFTAIRTAPATVKSLPGEQINRNASVITGLPIDAILFPGAEKSPKPLTRELWISRSGISRRLSNASWPIRGHDMAKYLDVVSVSPDGRYVIKLDPILHVPDSWQAYVPLTGYEDWLANLFNMSPANYWRPRQYALIDLRNGRTRPLLDAPFGDSLAHMETTQAVWSEDGTRVLLTNTFLPLDNADAASSERTKQLCAVASIEPATGKESCVALTRDSGTPTADIPKPLRMQSVSFGATRDDVIVHLGRSKDGSWVTEFYRRDHEHWVCVKTTASFEPERPKVIANRSPITITIQQDLNHPPTLWARNAMTGVARALWNPNPQLSRSKLGSVSVFRWKDAEGNEFVGGLVKPVDYVVGKRYPLVIQTHGFQESEFLTDGPFATAMAARALSSAGMFVLQIGSNHLHYGEASEAHSQVLGYKAAIDQLVSEGMIDPRRVGIIGFSRTCWYVETALIEAPERFAAASLSDGIDQSYMQSMIFDPDRPSETQRMYHSQPFAEGLKQWMELAPDFHLDKVQAPVLLTAIKPSAVLEEWEIYSSLYQQKKPVEFIYVPDGQHVLQKPLDRLASQQLNVDWFCFWLKNEQGAPSRRDPQMERWQHLRQLQAASKTSISP